MEIKRKEYIDQLVSKRENGMIKIVSGVRRCGKSYLLFELSRCHLLESGVREDHIISLALDNFDERKYRDPREQARCATA